MSWNNVRLGDVCLVKRGTTITEKQAIKGSVPVVAGGISYSYKHNQANRSANVITVSASGANAGYVNFWDVPIFASDCSTVEPIGKEIDIRFIFYFLKNKQDFINKTMRSGAAQPHVYAKDIAQITLKLPPLAEQKRIASILDKANVIKSKRELALAKLDELAQSKFIDMFGDVIKNPKNLPVKQLKDILKLKSGDALTASSMNESGIYQVYGGNGVNGLHDNFMYEDKIIVIGRVGAYCGCVHITSEKCWVTDNALAVKILDSNINFEYLAFALKEANLNQYSSQSGQPLISGSRLYPINIITPSLLMQENFAKIKVSIDAQKEVLSKSNNLISLFLKSLYNQAFTTGFNA